MTSEFFQALIRHWAARARARSEVASSSETIASMSCRHGQQVQVVITEHRYGGRAEALDRAQHGERIRTPIDEVANQP